MTCYHKIGDPDCDKTKIAIRTAVEREVKSSTPDAEKYTIEDMARVGSYLVLKVKYPNCINCAYEGLKVMVFLNISELQVLKWKRIDPHFRDPKLTVNPTESPSPAARFPASKEGWDDALAYAKSKSNI